MIEVTKMNNLLCRQCAHYHQHYALDNRKIFRIYCGHCMLHKPRKKLPDAIACEAFAPAPPDENTFATKEYLSKELLQYVLSLDLLPPIADGEQISLK